MHRITGFACIALCFGSLVGAMAQPVKLGAGTYYLSPKGDKPPPQAPSAPRTC